MSSIKFFVIITDSAKFNPSDIQVFSSNQIQNYNENSIIGSNVTVIYPWSVNQNDQIINTGKIVSNSFQ